MNIEEIREHCISKPGTTEGFPFGEQTLVFKVMGKMFALLPLDDPVSMNLKCDPEYALELRERYEGRIRPGWHMNKKHWNTVSLVDNLESKLIGHLINHSYDLVVSKLKKADKEALRAIQE